MQSIPSEELLAHYVLSEDHPIYTIGPFSSGVTVWGQQIRALNLAWGLIEAGTLSVSQKQPQNIAVVGAGFAGLTFVAALLKKRIPCTITLFEEHDTLLPLQQGSDSRWLHPHNYDWPDKGSEADVAMLPIMNWTAARASDVVVQVLDDWRSHYEDETPVQLFCNTRHLHLTTDETDQNVCRIEWVGEERDPTDGTILGTSSTAKGGSSTFSIVILAVGFGIEHKPPSYWRNETIGQPLLNQSRRTYLISGQGDGAMIDLIRVRLSHYRQDRILEDIFGGKDKIRKRLEEAKRNSSKTEEQSLFSVFDSIFEQDAACRDESIDVFRIVSKRLRRDTDAILRIKVPDVATLLSSNTSKMSFQNSLLIYLLYRVGGFAPSCDPEESIIRKYSIPKEYVVRRHGTDREKQFKRILSATIFRAVKKRIDEEEGFGTGYSELNWPGGYFDQPGSFSESRMIADDEIRKSWRREYLPGPTTLVAATLCGAIVGMIQDMKSNVNHLRVTFHRVLPLNRENLLQQTCEYQGVGIDEDRASAGRTFPADKAMIGLAYGSHCAVHTRASALPKAIEEAMVELDLKYAARSMAPEVSYILAIPLLQPSDRYYPPSPVAGVVYLDSRDENFKLTRGGVRRLSKLVAQTMESLVDQSMRALLGVRNIPFNNLETGGKAPVKPVTKAGMVIEVLPESISPRLEKPLAINFDYADPASVGRIRGRT